jgi:lipopolysaccharide export system protein LptA
MVCKNCAAMQKKTSPLPLRTIALSLALLGMAPAWAEKADRLKPLNIVSERQGSIDLVNQRTEFIGDVVLTKGTLLLRAEKVDVRETSDGYYQAYASGQPGKQVSFRQASDTPGESIQGAADQLEYDTRADTVRFIGNAVVRHMRGSGVANEVTGAVIVFDNRSEVFTLEAGQASPYPNGRVRVVMMPRPEASPAASAPATAASGIPLRPSTTLQPRKPS